MALTRLRFERFTASKELDAELTVPVISQGGEGSGCDRRWSGFLLRLVERVNSNLFVIE